MADISVTLALDDKDYTTKLTKATTASKTFGTTANTAFNSTKSGIQGMVTGIDSVTSKFSGLGKAVAAIGMGSFVTSLIKAADELTDTADALGITTEKLMELQGVAVQSGGSVEGLQGMMAKLNTALGDAAGGNDKAITSFNKLGLSVSGLMGLNPDQRFQAIAQSLASIEDPATRTSMAVDVLGKKATSIDWNKFSDGAKAATGSMKNLAEAQKTAGDIADQWAKLITDVKNEFLALISPLLNVVDGVLKMANEMNLAKPIAIALAGILATMVGSAVLNGLKLITGLFELLTGVVGASAGATALATASATNYGRAVGTFLAGGIGRVGTAQMAVNLALVQYNALAASGTATTEVLAAAQTKLTLAQGRLAAMTEAAALTQAQAAGSVTALGAASGAAAAPIAGAGVAAGGAATGFRALMASMLPMIGTIAAVAAAAGSLYAVWQSLWGDDGIAKGGGGSNWISDLVNKTIDLATGTKAVGDQQKKNNEEAARAAEAARIQREEVKKINDSYSEQATKLSDVTKSMAVAMETARGRADIEAKFNANQKDAMDIALAGYDAQAKANQDIMKLDAEQAAAKIKFIKEIGDAQAAVDAAAKAGQPTKDLQEKLDAHKAGAAAVTAEYEKQKATVQAVAEQATALKQLEIERKIAIETQNKVYEIQRQGQSKMMDLEKESAQMTMSSNAQRLDSIKRERAAAIDAARAEFEHAHGRKMNAQEEAAIVGALETQWDGIYAKTEQNIGKSNEFSTGWKKAMADYQEAAGDSASKANELFKTGTKGMEDALVGFAKTGKLEWKGLLSDMLEQLLRWGIQKAFAGIMEGLSGGEGFGGLLSKVGSMFSGLVGGGGGGTSSGGSRSTGGGTSSGGGLGDLMSGAWDTVSGWFGGGSGSSGSSGSSGGNADNSSIYSDAGYGDTNYSSGYASDYSSYEDPFAGFYAKGGLIPAGKYGIVGENGPEKISGPAQITPMDQGGGQMNITIYANDALSFKQMLARDPTFLSALVMQGNRGIPGAA